MGDPLTGHGAGAITVAPLIETRACASRWRVRCAPLSSAARCSLAPCAILDALAAHDAALIGDGMRRHIGHVRGLWAPRGVDRYRLATAADRSRALSCP